MKSFLVFGFFLTVIAFSSGFYVKETAPLPLQTNIRQNEPSKAIILNPRARKEPKIGRFVYLKNLMELRCLKKVFDDIRNKNRFKYLKPNLIPLEITGVKNLKNQISNELRGNFLNIQPLNNVRNRIIFLPPNNRFPLRENNEVVQNKTIQLNSNAVLANHSRPTVKNINQTSPLDTDLYKNNEKFSKAFATNESIPKANTSGSYLPAIQQKPKDVNSTLGVPPKQSKPIQTQPRDVKDAIKENPAINKNNEKFKNSNSGRKPIEKFNVYLNNGGHPGRINNPITYSDVKEIKTDNAVLKSFIRSDNSSITKTKEIIINSPSQNGYLSTDSKTYSNNRPPVYQKDTIENRPFVSRKEQSKQLKITIPNIEKSSNFTSTVRIEIENVSRISTTDVSKVTNAPKTDLKTEKDNHSSIQTTAMPEIYTFESFNKILEVENEKQKTDVQTSIPITITEDIKTEVKTVTEKENSQTFSEIQTTLKQTTKEFINEKIISTDSPNEITEIATKEMKNVDTNIPELELTPSGFKEFTDYPMNFDLLTTVIKDQEPLGKNSRKMHFEPEILATTTSNRLGGSEQRRSDILIDENSDDYILDESSSGLNYIEEIKQNSSFLSSKSDYIIKLIPVVINDLRENKIPLEDIPILSKFFAEHWANVVALSEKTDVDMLPLLKMKNEEDLKNILHSNFPEESEGDNETEETNDDSYTIYEYEDDYKSLNEDGSGEVFERGGRFQRNTEDAKYFDRVKNSLNKYDEEQNEERFMFELLNLKNLNLRRTNKVF